jgi:hypothetical protein
MRIKSTDDLSKLGTHARRQIEEAIQQQGAIAHKKRLSAASELRNPKAISSTTSIEDKNKPNITKKTAPIIARVMTDPTTGLKFCPWPSPDPAVFLHQLLEKRFGCYHQGGRMASEMIIDGGSKMWRFDFTILPWHQDSPKNFTNGVVIADSILIIEMDGFGYHRSLTAFKNDRAKQTHALMQGFTLLRITNEDIRKRSDDIIGNIEKILLHQRSHHLDYKLIQKGKTQSIFIYKKN